MSADFYTKQLAALVGMKVSGVVVDDGAEFFGLEFVSPNNTKMTMWLLRDDEGNGPGSFDLVDG